MLGQSKYPEELFTRTRKGTHKELGLGRGFILFEIGFLSAFRNGDDYDADVLVESKSIARGTQSTEFSLTRYHIESRHHTAGRLKLTLPIRTVHVVDLAR